MDALKDLATVLAKTNQRDAVSISPPLSPHPTPPHPTPPHPTHAPTPYLGRYASTQVQRVREALQSSLQTEAGVPQHIAAVQAVPANYSEQPGMHTTDFGSVIASNMAASAHGDRCVRLSRPWCS